MFNKFMSAIFSSTKVKKDNSNQVIAAANLAPVATQTNSVNIDHTLLTDEQLIEVAEALVAKKAAEAKVDATKAAEALELKQKQELLKVTNALAATTRKLRAVTESAAKTHEELLFQEIYLEEAQADICAATNESEVVGAASAAMTKDDARILLAERRAQLAGQRNAASQERSYTNNAGSHSATDSSTKKEPKWPVALAALQSAGFSEKQAKRIIDSSKSAASVTGYVEAIVAKDPKRAAEAAVIAGVLNDPAVNYYAKNWKQYLTGAPATSAPATSAPSTPPAGFTTPAGADTTTPSTKGAGVVIPSGVGDVAGDIKDNTVE